MRTKIYFNDFTLVDFKKFAVSQERIDEFSRFLAYC